MWGASLEYTAPRIDLQRPRIVRHEPQVVEEPSVMSGEGEENIFVLDSTVVLE